MQVQHINHRRSAGRLGARLTWRHPGVFAMGCAGLSVLALVAWLISRAGLEGWVACATLLGAGAALFGIQRRASALRQSESRASGACFRALADASPHGIFLANASGQLTYTSRSCQRILRQPAPALEGSGWLEFVHPADRTSVRGAWASACASGTRFIREVRFVHPDGTVIRGALQASPIHHGPRAAGFAGTLEDVTEARASTQRLRDAERRFDHLFHSIGDAIVLTDTERRIRITNEAFNTMFGYADPGLLVGELAEVLYAEAALYEEAGRRISSREDDAPFLIETRFRRANGEVFDVELRLCFLRDDDGVIGNIGVVRDVSERKAARANLAALIENTGDVIWSIAPGYRLLSSNAAFQQSVKPQIGRELAPGECVFTPGFTPEAMSMWKGYYDRAFAGEQFVVESETHTPGEPGYRELRLNPIRGADGAVIGVAAFSRDVTERRNSEAALRASEERYRKTFDSLHDVFHQTDLEDRFVMVSPSSLSLHGYTPEELLGTHSRDLFVDPADHDRIVEHMTRGHVVNDFEARMRNKDGRIVHVSINVKLVFDEDGVAYGVQGTTRDITARKHAEDALRESEERYRSTFESLHDVFYQTGREGAITLVSPSCLRHTGYTPGELTGRHVGDLFVADGRFEGLLARLRQSGSVDDYEAALRRKDGAEIPVSLNGTALRGADGEVLGFQGTMRDITERKLAEEERDRIFTLSVDMLSVVASGGILLRVNHAWQSTLGYTLDELIGQNVWSFIHPEDLADARHGARGVELGEAVHDLSARFRCKDGSWRWLSWSITPTSADGTTYCVARDVTELMRAREELEETVEATRSSQAALEEQTEAMDRMRIEAEYLANHDTLTGVVNRRAWFAHALAKKPTAIAIFDIDLFKKVNDSYGHPAGDAVLREVAVRLQSALPADALLGRLGGEEFAVVFTGDLGGAGEACEAAVEAVAAGPIYCEGAIGVTVTVSGGLAAWRAGAHSREESLANTYEEADAALYEAKAAGRRRLVVRLPRQAA